MSRRSLIARLQDVSAADMAAFLAAWGLLGCTAAALRLLPFARIAPWLGPRASSEPSADPNAHQIARAWFVHRAVNRAAVRAPFRSDCLPQALVAALFCRWLHLPAIVSLGVRLDGSIEEGPMRAHAWVYCGEVPITGRPGARHFGTVARFLCYTPK